MAEPFSLDELIPEVLTVRLAGQVYDVRMVAHLGPAEYAQFSRLQAQVTTALVAMRDGSEEEQVTAGTDIADATNRLVGILIPTMTPETIVGMSFAKKSAFLDYWRQKQPSAAPASAPKKTTGKQPTPARRLSV